MIAFIIGLTLIVLSFIILDSHSVLLYLSKAELDRDFITNSSISCAGIATLFFMTGLFLVCLNINLI